MRSGLQIIASRSESLSRFLGAYARLAKLPRPRLEPVDLRSLVERVVALETRLAARIEHGPPLLIQADRDQLEQVLINLLRNAVDASLENRGSVTASWRRQGVTVELEIKDEGKGLAATSNLFVPFFTTKPGGSGIGLVLSRQITEAHGGTLRLVNRTDSMGCTALLTLPISADT